MKSVVGLVTCRDLPEPDPDQELLLGALPEAGLDAEMLAWDDPEADPGGFDLCVLRSCWNYYLDPEAFLAWIEHASARSCLMNPQSVVRWNLHKSYLRELEAEGTAIIPTAWFDAGAHADLREAMRARGWDDVVIKPAVSAASFRTRRFHTIDLAAGQAFLTDLVRERDAMLQPYVAGAADPGERALIWIDGELTHSVIKRPRFAGGVESVSEAAPLSAEEFEIATAAVSRFDGDLLYARIDLVHGQDGEFLISELELMEPSLYLLQSALALRRLVRAVVRMCRAG